MKAWLFVILILWSCTSLIMVYLVIGHVISRIKNNACKEQLSVLELYTSQMDIYLSAAFSSLIEVAHYNNDLLTIQMSDNPTNLALAKSNFHTTLSSMSISEPHVSGFFTYIQSDGAGNAFFAYATNEGAWYADNNSISTAQLKDFVEEITASENLDTIHWLYYKINDKNYLFRIVCSKDTYVGCYISLDLLIQPMTELEYNSADTFFAASNGEILTQGSMQLKRVNEFNGSSGTVDITLDGNSDYIEIYQKLSVADIYLVTLNTSSKLMGAYNPLLVIQFILLVVPIMIFIFLIINIMIHLFIPLRDFLHTIEKIKAGNTDERVRSNSSFSEIQDLTTAFNEMLDETKALKISIYEQQLKERQTYFNYLQLQIRPHFFLNTLNLVHSLAQLKQYKEIQNLVTYMVRYFRFMLHKTTPLITVNEEVAHVDNYIAIQKIRFPKELTVERSVDENLRDALIPPLSIQTFVENSIKYVLNMKNGLKIFITVEKLNSNMKVTIKDNGKGFSPEKLVTLNTKQAFDDNSENCIGIQNIKERFHLIFGEEFYIHFYNEHGAVVEYILPIKRKGEENVSDSAG